MLVIACTIVPCFVVQSNTERHVHTVLLFPSRSLAKTDASQNYQQLLVQYRGKILPRMHPATIAVERVGSRIFRAACDFARENNLDYFDTKTVTFTVVDSEQANAFVLPGNHVFGEWFRCCCLWACCDTGRDILGALVFSPPAECDSATRLRIALTFS